MQLQSRLGAAVDADQGIDALLIDAQTEYLKRGANLAIDERLQGLNDVIVRPHLSRAHFRFRPQDRAAPQQPELGADWPAVPNFLRLIIPPPSHPVCRIWIGENGIDIG